jgi:hypothetical protein
LIGFTVLTRLGTAMVKVLDWAVDNSINYLCSEINVQSTVEGTYFEVRLK